MGSVTVLAVAVVGVGGVLAVVVGVHGVMFGGLVVVELVLLFVLAVDLVRVSPDIRCMFAGLVLVGAGVRGGGLADVRLASGLTCDETTELDRVGTVRIRQVDSQGLLDLIRLTTREMEQRPKRR